MLVGDAFKVAYKRLRRVSVQLQLQRALYLTLTPLWVLGVVVLRFVNRFKPIQLGGLNAGRLGHLVMDVEMFLSEREIGCPGYRMNALDLRYVWTAGLPISNNLILDLWRSQFKFGPRWLLQPVDRWNRRIPGGESTQTPWRKGPGKLNQHDDLYGALRNTAPHLPITRQHFDLAKSVLSDVRPSFDMTKPYVCIHVRDRTYFDRHQPNNRDDASRDADISDYESAIKVLTAMSINVVRMGALSNFPLTFKDDLVWDYACDGSRSELLDLVLPARCRFFISTFSGPDKIAQLFRRPVLFTNFAPLKSIPLWMTDSLIAPKRLRYLDGQYLTWREIFTSNFYTLKQEQLSKYGVEVVANSPEEIRCAVEEMIFRISHSHSDLSRVDDDWQSLLEIIPAYLKAGGVRARIAENFIKDR